VAVEIHGLVEVDTGSTPIRIWTGEGDLTAGGETYQGMASTLEIGPIEAVTGSPDRRLQLRIGAIPMALRAQFLQDPGPRPVTVRLARVSRTGSAPAATLLPTLERGRLSTVTMQEGVLEVEIETYRGDVDLGVPQLWSHEDQQRRYPGDRGLEYMRALARSGITGAWPP